MAKPIKITPVLRGRDAVNFINRVSANKESSVSKEEISEVRRGASLLQSIMRGKR